MEIALELLALYPALTFKLGSGQDLFGKPIDIYRCYHNNSTFPSPTLSSDLPLSRNSDSQGQEFTLHVPFLPKTLDCIIQNSIFCCVLKSIPFSCVLSHLKSIRKIEEKFTRWGTRREKQDSLRLTWEQKRVAFKMSWVEVVEWRSLFLAYYYSFKD